MKKDCDFPFQSDVSVGKVANFDHLNSLQIKE